MISVNTFDRADRSLFDYKAFIVLTDSMAKTDFAAGDLVLVKEVDPDTLKPGDIISYISRDPQNNGKTVTHKIRQRTTDAYGAPGFITYGTTTDINDDTVVTYPNVLGKYQGRIPKVGGFFQFLKTAPGYILCVFIPLFALIVFQGINCVKLFRQYRREQLAQLQEEQAKSQQMLAQIQALQAQLAAQTAQQDVDSDS